MQRRDVLAAVGAAAAAWLAGCSYGASTEEPAHTVSVYLVDSEVARDVTVTITDDEGTTLFDTEHSLSKSNEADENVPFPAASDPETIVITIDDRQFERDWPGLEQPELPCSDATQAGVEIWIDTDEDGSLKIRLEANCQSVTMGG